MAFEFENIPQPTFIEKAVEQMEDIELYFLDYSAPIEKPTPVIYDPTDPDRFILTEGNFITICGEAKSYKSFCASLFTIDYYTQHPSGKCVWIDTEQADWNVANIAHRICKGMGWRYTDAYSTEKLKIAKLRQFNTEERIKAVSRIVEKTRPQLLVIDGIRDLVNDINDWTESKAITDLLAKFTVEFKTNIICVLHTNKDGETLRGALGTEIQNKSEAVFICKKRENGERGANVSSKYARNPDIDPFDIEIDSLFVPRRVEKPFAIVPQTFNSKKQQAAYDHLPVTLHASKEWWLLEIGKGGDVSSTQTQEKYFDELVRRGILIADDRNGRNYSHTAALRIQPKEIQPVQVPELPIVGENSEQWEDNTDKF